MTNVFEAVESNKNKSAIIMVLFVLFTSLVVYFLSLNLSSARGLTAAITATVFSLITTLGSYFWGDQLILRMSQATPATKKDHFNFYTVTENLCLATQQPLPKLYVINDSALNAFATGRDPKHASVCVTSGLLSVLNRSELEGVIGHELAHVINYDTRLMTIVSVLVGTITLLADWLIRSSWLGRRSNDDDQKSSSLGGVSMVIGIILAFLSPLIAQLIQLAISRTREYLADATSVNITRQPSGLISALGKLGADREPLEVANKATAHLFIVNPLQNLDRNTVGIFASLFSTHPPLVERISRLQNMM